MTGSTETGASRTTGASGTTGPSGRATGPTSVTGPSGATEQPTAVEPDAENLACRLLNEDVAEPIIGVDLAVAGDVHVGNHSSCVLRNAEQTISVELRVTEGGDAKREYDALYATVEGEPGVRVIDGVGDEAFRAVAANDAHTLVLVGQTLVRLSTAAESGALAEETLELARALVAEL